MEEFTVKTRSRQCLVDITNEVTRAVASSGVSDGVCVVFVPHTTAGVTINENADPSVRDDLDAIFTRLVPRDAGYRHMEGNSDSHAKATLVGMSETILLVSGRLVLGTWQGIYFCEFDGPRTRRCIVKVIAG